MTKIHRLARTTDVDGMGWTLCGRLDPLHRMRGQTEAGEVTCANCRKALEASPGFTPADLAEPAWTAPDPKPVDVDRVVWGDLPGYTRRLAEVRRKEAGPRRYRAVEDAARVVAVTEADGYASGSASQSVERIGQTGTRVQTSGRGSSKTSRRAEEVATLKLAIATALEQWADLPTGVTPALAWRVYRDRRVGSVLKVREWEGRSREARTHLASDDSPTVARRYGLSVRVVDLTAMEARRAILFELAVRHLVRVPQSMRPRVERERAKRAERRAG